MPRKRQPRSYETVYRVRWMRQKWTHPRAAVFLSRRKADEWVGKLWKAWPAGPNPLVWVEVDYAKASWLEATRVVPNPDPL